MTLRPAHSLILAATLAINGAIATGRSQQPDGATTLSLGESAAPAGSPVVAPLTLSAAGGLEIGAVEVRLTFPTALLTFEKIEPSGLSLAVDAVVQAEVKAEPGGQSSTLLVKVFTAPGSGKALPSGLLAYVGFKIHESAKPETSIALALAAEALTAGEPRQPVTPVAAANATIKVARPPVPACFFYMH